MLSCNNMILSQILFDYNMIEQQFNERIIWNNMHESELWEELCLCILSSNVLYDLAKSSYTHLKLKGYLDSSFILETADSTEIIALELSKSIYIPLRKNGCKRKYRFPNIRAKNIVDAAKFLYFENDGIYNLLELENEDVKLRDFLAKTIPGFGLKQSSHFLRNIGFSKVLAVVDVHILEFLRRVYGISLGSSYELNHQLYLDIENFLLEICELMNLELSVFDYAIWNFMRGV